MKKQIVGVLMTLLVVGVGLTGETVYGAERELPTGRMETRKIILPSVDEEEVFTDEDAKWLIEQSSYGAAIYDSEWDKYKNYYVYNQLNETERAFWDAFDSCCMEFLMTNKDANAERIQGTTYYYMDLVPTEGLSAERAFEIAYMFREANPQYYFLNDMYVQSDEGAYAAWCVYSSFADGARRSEATQCVKNQADVWEQQVETSCDTDAEKAQMLYEIIIDKVDYNDAYYGNNFDEDTQYSQSVYSVFCGDYTVCAGYAGTYAMMCNACGVDALTVTSLEHAWNKVCVDDSWYNVDATWGDAGGSDKYYDYYARSDAAYDNDTAERASTHQEEDYWEPYLPPCTLDTNSTEDAPGSFPVITGRTAAPTIQGNYVSGEYQVEINCTTAGARIYYTLDGTTPSSASTKSNVYTGAITTTSTDVRAMAVYDTYFDSEVTAAELTPPEGLVERDGKYYFYENGVMATSKEAYVNGAWRWFDADGTMAVNKDVYQTSSGGKWVRYNENGEMIKGEDYRYGGWYYFEPITGTMMKGPIVLADGRKVFYDTTTGQMVKGTCEIDGQTYVFDEDDGHLLSGNDTLFWVYADGKKYWYENWQRQGFDPANEAYRGKEIYDPASDAWYWLDNVQQGGMAVSKDVYQESWAGEFADREDGTGKWVRYDETGHMVKGWQTNGNGTYYFDLTTGAMAKGWAQIDGGSYYFDETTGVLR